MSINWYPGHIAKAERKLKEQLSLVDVIIEVLDARIPLSSTYDNLERLTSNKPRLLLLNKADISDQNLNIEWQKYYAESLDKTVLLTSSNSNKDISTVINSAIKVGKPAIEKIIKKGLLPRPVRAMVIGLPNVGKSSIINKLIKASKAKVGAKAGVTRASQWIRVNPKLDLLDTPGIIPMHLEDQTRATKLAMVNSVGEAAYDKLEVAKELLNLLFERYKETLYNHYNLQSDLDFPTLEEVAKSRNLLLSKDKFDIDRCASMILRDFRQGKIGRITLEDVPQI